MGHIEATNILTASPEAVWKIISNPQTWGDWFTVHAGWIEDAPTTITQGSKLVEKIVMLGMANKLEWTVTDIEESKKLAMSGTGMAGVKVGFAFVIEPDEVGSKFSVIGDFEGALIKGALGKAVEKDFGKQLTKTIAQLDALAAA